MMEFTRILALGLSFSNILPRTAREWQKGMNFCTYGSGKMRVAKVRVGILLAFCKLKCEPARDWSKTSCDRMDPISIECWQPVLQYNALQCRQPAAPPIKYGLGYRSRTLTLNPNLNPNTNPNPNPKTDPIPNPNPNPNSDKNVRRTKRHRNKST